MALVTARLQHANRAAQFQAFSLRAEGGVISPILGVDHYWMHAPTFPPHHHAGMSAVSYLLRDSETGMDNRDSIGTVNLIQPGGLHWTTAGRGVNHEEVPAERGKSVHGLQIFVGLAPSKRDIAPFPLTIDPDQVPIVTLPGATVHVPVGQFAGARSPLIPPTEMTLLDIQLDASSELNVPLPKGYGGFAMVINGTVEIDGQSFSKGDLQVPVFPAQDVAQDLVFKATQDGATLVIFSGPPLPIA
ncbi:pirin [Xanthomonas arboricola]|uniref:pirin family protein n=1 Tax=Xanthomonas arboricola TaxID=56448 RepID=UPI00061A2BDD|nr:pirin family protein [Xanthomonas arboricola]AKC80645.1 pirin [Xanthomonas arboricola]